jgi:hypothetical protein
MDNYSATIYEVNDVIGNVHTQKILKSALQNMLGNDDAVKGLENLFLNLSRDMSGIRFEVVTEHSTSKQYFYIKIICSPEASNSYCRLGTTAWLRHLKTVAERIGPDVVWPPVNTLNHVNIRLDQSFIPKLKRGLQHMSTLLKVDLDEIAKKYGESLVNDKFKDAKVKAFHTNLLVMQHLQTYQEALRAFQGLATPAMDAMYVNPRFFATARDAKSTKQKPYQYKKPFTAANLFYYVKNPLLVQLDKNPKNIFGSKKQEQVVTPENLKQELLDDEPPMILDKTDVVDVVASTVKKQEPEGLEVLEGLEGLGGGGGLGKGLEGSEGLGGSEDDLDDFLENA